MCHQQCGMRKWIQASLYLFCGTTLSLSAAPFVIETAAVLRSDAVVDWSDYSTDHAAVIPGLHSFMPSDGGTPVKPWAPGDSDVTIWNTTGAETPGVLLSNSGPGQIYIYFDRGLQGLGFMIESLHNAPTTYAIDCFAFGGGFFTRIEVDAADGGAAFMGLIDPDARIGVIGVRSSSGNDFLIGDLTLQIPTVETEDPSTLPVEATHTVAISNTATYLHEGVGFASTTSATTEATESNANAYDLLEWFPSLRAGDLIHCERLGYSFLSGIQLNDLVGVFSSTEEIDGGDAFQRVTGAIKAGADVYTAPVRGRSGFETPSNISQDFRISTSSFVSVPDQARYLMLSLAEPSAEVSPVQFRVSHIQKDAFDEWVAAQGMHGPNALPEEDLDGDGLSLIEEFVFGKDPTVADGSDADFAFQPKLNPLAELGQLSLMFGARTDAPIRYWAEYSSDLENWDRETTPIATPFRADSTGERALFIASDPEPADRRFGRIVIEYLND